MYKIKKFLVLLIIIFFGSGLVSAEENQIVDPILPDTNTLIHLTIIHGQNTLYDQNINVEACESNNPASGNLKITPYCSILQSGLSNDWNSDWAPGIFLNSINDIAGYTSEDSEGNPVYSYWSWSLNNVEAMVGLNQYELLENDLITLTFINPVIETEPIIEPEPVSEPEPVPEPEIIIPSSSRSSSQKTIKKAEEKREKIFNLEKAFDFLIKNQKENGSFGSEMYTDWATIALMSSEKYLDTKIQLYKYYANNKLENPNLTDYQRRSMALLSMGLNPSNINGENYIKEIIQNFDGKQFGNLAEINDDIFALLVLNKVGYTLEDLEIKNTLDFILAKQNENGSWNNSVDLTSAGIISLVNFKENEKIKISLEKAKEFLKNTQQKNGGWENSFSTTWVLGALSALEENVTDWTKNKENPVTYLTKNENNYSEIKEIDLNNKIWEMSYLLTSLSGKSWNEIMQNFPKEEIIKKEFPVKKATNSKIKIENLETPKENSEIQNLEEKIETKSPEGTEAKGPEGTEGKENKFKKMLKKIIEIIF
jgi:hypothetical protein